MIQFIDSSKKYPVTIPMVVATVALVLIVYFLGGSGLLFDYEYAQDLAVSKAADTSQYIQVLGSNRVLFWMLLPFTLSFVISETLVSLQVFQVLILIILFCLHGYHQACSRVLLVYFKQ